MVYITRQISKFLMILILTTSFHIAHAEVVDNIAAYVGNRVVTMYDIQSLDPVQYREILNIKDEELRKSRMKDYEAQALDYLVNQAVIEISAEREGIKVSEKEIDTAIEEIVKRNNLDPKKLEEYLAKENMSMAKYRMRLKSDILNARVRGQVLMPKMVIVEKDIRAAADENADEYSLHDKYKVRLLLTQTKETMDKALKELKGGKSFDEVVKVYSIDKSAADGGNFGSLEVDILAPVMRDTLKKTKVGEMTKPFEHNGQWAVFMVDEIKSKYDFDDEVRAKLEEAAAEKLFTKVFQSWLERNKETIVILKEGAVFEAR